MVEFIQAAPRSIASIGAFADRKRVLGKLQAEFGFAVPVRPGFAQAGGIILSCLAPGRFLASGERDADLPRRVCVVLDGIAAVTDQSDMWDVWIVSGVGVREVLARIVPIDLHPAVFGVGGLALTRAGHVDVRLWRTGDMGYELAAQRSYAGDVRHQLESALRGR